jgi:hypothetical protein
LSSGALHPAGPALRALVSDPRSQAHLTGIVLNVVVRIAIGRV